MDYFKQSPVDNDNGEEENTPEKSEQGAGALSGLFAVCYELCQ